MRCALKVALLACVPGLAAATCLPEDEACAAPYDADQDSLIQLRDRRAHASQAPSSCPTPPSNCTGYNPRFCVYTEPRCSERSLPGCLGFNDCRYCGQGGEGWEPCPGPSPAADPMMQAFAEGKLLISMEDATTEILSKCMRLEGCRPFFYFTSVDPSVPQALLHKGGPYGVFALTDTWYADAPQGENIHWFDAFTAGGTQLKNPPYPDAATFAAALRQQVQEGANEKASCKGSSGTNCGLRPNVGYDVPPLEGVQPTPVNETQCTDRPDRGGKWQTGKGCVWTPDRAWVEHSEVRVVFQASKLKAGPSAVGMPLSSPAHNFWQDGPRWLGPEARPPSAFRGIIVNVDALDHSSPPSEAEVKAYINSFTGRFRDTPQATQLNNMCCMIAAGDDTDTEDHKAYPVYLYWFLASRVVTPEQAQKVGVCLQRGGACAPDEQFAFLKPANQTVSCSQSACGKTACQKDACLLLCSVVNATQPSPSETKCLANCSASPGEVDWCGLLKTHNAFEENTFQVLPPLQLDAAFAQHPDLQVPASTSLVASAAAERHAAVGKHEALSQEASAKASGTAPPDFVLLFSKLHSCLGGCSPGGGGDSTDACLSECTQRHMDYLKNGVSMPQP